MNITDFAIIGDADYAVALQPLAVNTKGLPLNTKGLPLNGTNGDMIC